MQLTGACASSPAFQQPANFNVVLVKKTEMVVLWEKTSSTLKFRIVGSGSEPGVRKVVEGL